MQDPSSIYVDSTYSPTPKIHHIFSVISRLVGEGYEMDTADFETAYLNAPIDGDIYMIIDSDTIRILLQLYEKTGVNYLNHLDEKDRLFVKLNKAIYGLQQSAKLWNSTASNALKSMGYKQNSIDECIFYNDNGIIILYADDLLLIHKTKEINDSILSQLSKTFTLSKTSNGSNIFNYLGMNLHVNKSMISISMKQF